MQAAVPAGRAGARFLPKVVCGVRGQAPAVGSRRCGTGDVRRLRLPAPDGAAGMAEQLAAMDPAAELWPRDRPSSPAWAGPRHSAGRQPQRDPGQVPSCVDGRGPSAASRNPRPQRWWPCVAARARAEPASGRPRAATAPWLGRWRGLPRPEPEPRLGSCQRGVAPGRHRRARPRAGRHWSGRALGAAEPATRSSHHSAVSGLACRASFHGR